MNLELPLDVPRSKALTAAIRTLATNGGTEERGAVFTKAGVVEAILDLCSYTVDQSLHKLRFLEPSFGDGDFLLAAIERLLVAFERGGGTPSEWVSLKPAIRGVELHTATYKATRSLVVKRLIQHGFADAVGASLANTWLVNDDFLLADLVGKFDVVAGNPPYVRQERIPSTLLQTYKRNFATLYDRADLYVLFYERGLDLLSTNGVLGYICANRWVKNKYGGPLRKKVADGFRLKFFIDLERADAFHAEVFAYPAITVIQRGEAGQTHVALDNRHTASGLDGVVDELIGAEAGSKGTSVASVPIVPVESDPWLLDVPGVVRVLRRIEASFSTLEEAGAKVGIGVATGADRVFVGDYDALPVEEERKLPLAIAADCVGGCYRPHFLMAPPPFSVRLSDGTPSQSHLRREVAAPWIAM